MVHEVHFRPAAAADLKRIYMTIAREAGHKRAGDFITRIEATCLALAEFPKRGTVRDHVFPGLRIIGFERSASIAFVVESGGVNILRIFSRSMDFPDEWMGN